MDDRAWKRLIGQAALAKKLNMPIQFYGKIIDQNNAPVSGVDVFISVTANNEQLVEDLLKAKEKGIFLDSPYIKVTNLALQSDVNGLFCIDNMRGDSLHLEILKEGYLSLKNKFYHYEKAKDYAYQRKESPEIFPVWRLSESLPHLSTISFRFRLSEPNVYYIDLSRRKLVTQNDTNDLICSYKIEKHEVKERFDWTFQIEASEGGGISETNEVFMFRAPEKYEPKWSWSMGKNDRCWSMLKKNFYIVSRNGKQYANIQIDFQPDLDGSASLAIESAINSSGSKNLERVPLIDRKSHDEYINRQIKEKMDFVLKNPVIP